MSSSSTANTEAPEIHRRGLMLVLSSPSGAGKTSIAQNRIAMDGNITWSVSATTRPMRPGEKDGVDYHFVDVEKFEKMVEEEAFIEHARVFGNFYGTPRRQVDDALLMGRDVLFDIDWQGTQQISEKARDDIVRVFILPPSAEELERRLLRRAQDEAPEIANRMGKAASEMSHWAEYDYVIVNHEMESSVAKVSAILSAERLRRRRQTGLSEFVKQIQDKL